MVERVVLLVLRTERVVSWIAASSDYIYDPARNLTAYKQKAVGGLTQPSAKEAVASDWFPLYSPTSENSSRSQWQEPQPP